MMLHPATVHFAMVLPVVASVVGLVYLINKSESMKKLSSITILVSAIAMVVAWYTGSQAGPEIYDYLSEAGQHELVEHKQLGLYLAVAFSSIFVIKFIGCKTDKFILEVVSIALLLGATATTFLQGKDGGEIVYNYGMPFKAYMIEDSLNEANLAAAEEEQDSEKVEIYKAAIEDIKLLSQEVDGIYGHKEKHESNEQDD